MICSKIRGAILCLFQIVLIGSINAQSVLQIGQLPENQVVNTRKLAPLRDGGVVFVSQVDGTKKFFLNRTGADAKITKSISIPVSVIDTTVINNNIVEAAQIANGEIWLTYPYGNLNQNPQVGIARYTSDLNYIGSYSIPCGNGFRKQGNTFPTPDSGLVVFCQNTTLKSFNLIKIKSDGIIEWTQNQPLGVNTAAIRRVNPQGFSDDNGLTYHTILPNFIVLRFSPTNQYCFNSWAYDYKGSSLASFSRVLNYLPFSIDYNPSIVGVRKVNQDYAFYFSFFSPDAPFLRIYKNVLNTSGGLLSNTSFQDELLFLPEEIKHSVDDDGEILAAGNKHLFFRKDDGSQLTEVIPVEDPSYMSLVYKLTTPHQDGGYWIYGVIKKDNGQTQDLIARLLPNDFQLSGKLFEDINQNCLEEVGEKPYGARWVEFESDFKYYALSDSAGQYSAVLPEDTYQVGIGQIGRLWQLCPAQEQVIVNSDKTHILPIQPKAFCPDLFVDINAPYLVRCDTNEVIVRYRNEGVTPAINPYILFDVDTNLVLTSSSTPVSTISNGKYRVDLLDIPNGTEGEFKLNFYLDCSNTIVGQTHCINAHIYPDSLCLTPPACWDSSDYVIEGDCSGDTVIFKIKNRGLKAPSKPKPAIVLEDDIMRIAPFDINLLAGQDTTIFYEANGKTIRIEIPQGACFPYPSIPSLTLEGCGGIDQTGYVITLPQDDEASFLSKWCVESVDTKPSGFILGNPKGYSAERFISDSTQLEYVISFDVPPSAVNQNFYVVDSISSHLNINSFELGASNDKFQYQIYNNGVIRIDFKPVSQAGTQYIKLKATPRSGTFDGTKIYNKATIFYEDLLSVQTNQIFHTIGKQFLILDYTTTSIPNQYNISINVYPNPFSTQFKLSVEESLIGESTKLIVYDINGRMVYNSNFNSSNQIVETNQWNTGIYLWKLTKANEVIASGKMIRQ